MMIIERATLADKDVLLYLLQKQFVEHEISCSTDILAAAINEMLTRGFRTFLYNEQVATKRLKIASVAMTCDREPDINRARIANMIDAIMQAHPDVELVILGEMIR
jgi:hypothetical protein